MSPATALDRLSDRVREEGSPLAVKETAGAGGSAFGEPVFGELAAAGPRTSARAAEYGFVVEAVREGYLCHYGHSRILDEPDADLALLAGDLFYAIGIRGLAELDDLESTGILSDLIRVAAELQAAGRTEFTETLWLSQIVALSCGKDDAHQRAVAALEAGLEGAEAALTEWSIETAAANRMGRAFDLARSAIDSGPSNF